MGQAIHNAYVSVQIKDNDLNRFQNVLCDALLNQGMHCEPASVCAHVSLGYGEGDAEVSALTRVATEIAQQDFEFKINGFEILQGQATPFDYLVISLAGTHAMDKAVELVGASMPTKRFQGGMNCHVSLIKFAKGELSPERAECLVHELNASQKAAQALGFQPEIQGDSVCVFNLKRECCVRIPFRACA